MVHFVREREVFVNNVLCFELCSKCRGYILIYWGQPMISPLFIRRYI